jgi:hypothetical protein
MAQFSDELLAETVCDAVNAALSDAAREVDALFAAQNGVADIGDVSQIYLRHGFHNDSGWQQYRPLSLDNDCIIWEIPEGMNVQEAEQLLSAFGAISLMVEDETEDDLIRQVPHPAALFLSEFDDSLDSEEDEHSPGHTEEKKTLH